MAAPFGIGMHSQLSNYAVDSEIRVGVHFVDPPRRHPDFADYLVQSNRAGEVVWVKALSGRLQNDAYGSQTKALFDKISGQLSRNYGDPKLVDSLAPGSIWSEPRDWMSSIEQQERSFFALWERGGTARLPDDIESVFLGVTADHSGCSLLIEYASPKQSAADAEIDADLSDLL